MEPDKHPKAPRRRVYRQWMNVVGLVVFVPIGLFCGLLSFASSKPGYSLDQFAFLLLALMLLQIFWLVLWRPAFIIAPEGLVTRGAFTRTVIPYARVRRMVAPPEAARLAIELDDDRFLALGGFEPSLIVKWLGNRQEKRMPARFEAMRAAADPDPDAQVVTRPSWFAILFPTLTLLTFVAVIVVIENR